MYLTHILTLTSIIWSCTAIPSYGPSYGSYGGGHNRFVITGPPNFAYRMEIYDFVKDKQLFTLYIRALQSFQGVAETSDESFFGVGGIHGLPFQTWNGAQGGFPGTTNPDWTFGGYCTHGTEIFPTWHTPYVALYEQLLQSTASKIATKFTVNKAAWAKAAAHLRQPYWDWAKYALPPDEVIRESTVTITGYDGKDVSVTNPLLRYKFKAKLPLSYFVGSGYENWQTTLRQPDANGKENITRMVSILNSGHSQTRSDVVQLLTNVHDWDGFSNHASSENAITNSLESIHDNIHVEVGGNGHMGDPAVAGFDPIFFLHHTQVDRMIFLWSAMNPGVWVVPGAAPAGGTYTISPNATIDANTDLTPFWNTQNTFWRSYETTSTSKLGYSYADFEGIDLNNPQAVRAKVVAIIKQYMQAGTVPAPAAPAAAHSSSSTKPSNNSQILNWSLRIRAQHHELNGPYSVVFFLGNVPTDHTTWQESSTCVGTEYAFANSASNLCAKCNQTSAVSESYLHINDFIAKNHPELGSYNSDVITPFLKKNLAWRVLDTTGKPADLSSLDVTVFSVQMNWSEGADFPTAGQIQYYPDVTQGKTGGGPSR